MADGETCEGASLPAWQTSMNPQTAWLVLFVAGLFEVGWAIGLKYTEGFSRPLATSLTLIAMGASVWLLSMAMKVLPVGTAYAVWVGVGAVGTVVLGVWLFDEPTGALRIASVALIITGIIGLKLASSA